MCYGSSSKSIHELLLSEDDGGFSVAIYVLLKRRGPWNHSRRDPNLWNPTSNLLPDFCRHMDCSVENLDGKNVPWYHVNRIRARLCCEYYVFEDDVADYSFNMSYRLYPCLPFFVIFVLAFCFLHLASIRK